MENLDSGSTARIELLTGFCHSETDCDSTVTFEHSPIKTKNHGSCVSDVSVPHVSLETDYTSRPDSLDPQWAKCNSLNTFYDGDTLNITPLLSDCYTHVGIGSLNEFHCSDAFLLDSNMTKRYHFRLPFATYNKFDSLTLFQEIDSTGIGCDWQWPTRPNVNQSNDQVLLDTRTKVNYFTQAVNTSTLTTTRSVVNLSKRKLSEIEIEVLSLGKGFCPTPGEPDMGEIRRDLDKFHNNCRKSLFFSKETPGVKSSDYTSPPSISLSTPNLTPPPPTPRVVEGFTKKLLQEKFFRKPSTWVPPRGPPNFETFAMLNELAIGKEPIRAPNNPNLTREGQISLRNLAADDTIVIKQADKGGCLVLWDREDYITEGLRQLSDVNFYRALTSDPTKTHWEQIEGSLAKLRDAGQIGKKVFEAIHTDKYRCPEFYLLPKIHKNQTPTPGRPIISGNGGPTEKISGFVDFCLKPLVPLITSFAQDTNHVLEYLREIDSLSPSALLVSLDVTSLYTNIPNEEGIQACRLSLMKHRQQYNVMETEISNDNILALLRMVLTLNNFKFNGKHYLQVGGTAMGTRVAPTFANIFMGYFEDKFVHTYPIQPRLWLRFIDDVLMIWEGGHESLMSFISYLNSRHKNIKFSHEISETEVSFLDLLISKKGDGTIRTSLYSKPTDANNYLHFTSAHNLSCKTGIPYSQFLRIKRICSEDVDFVSHSVTKALHMKRRGYPLELLTSAFEAVCQLDRSTLLKRNKKGRPEDLGPDNGPMVGITTFHPSCKVFNRALRDNWNILGRSVTTESLSQKQLLVAYRRPKNLGDTLIRAKLSTSSDPGTRVPKSRCITRDCRYCKVLDKTGTIISTTTGRSYQSRKNVTCKSSNLIYCITCNICKSQYVGQTLRPFMKRAYAHHYSVVKDGDTSVARHFNGKNHDKSPNWILHILEFIHCNPSSKRAGKLRDEIELKWIHRLRTVYPEGMNVMDTKY